MRASDQALRRMAAGRVAAKAQRDQGGGTVRLVKRSWIAARERDMTAKEKAATEAAAHWRCVCDDVIAELEFILYGHEWEGM